MIRARLFSTLAFLALAAVFAPFVAPLVDHHSVERMPYHGHLHPVSAPHGHDTIVSHSHDDGTNAVSTTTVMPDRDGQAVQLASDIGADLFVQRRTQLRTAHAPGARALDEQRSPPDLVQSPPEEPPRA